jgi:LysM repeat protein
MGPFSLAAAALSLVAPPGAGSCGDGYTVARHDTLYSIARRCGLAVAEIARANRIHPTRIAAGQRLVLPGRGGSADKPGAEEGGLTYSFRRGDTLYSLARWARVSLRDLLAANPGIDPHKIEIGDPICLPHGAVPPEPMRLSERGRAHAPPPPPRVHIMPPRLHPMPPRRPHVAPQYAPPPPRHAPPPHGDPDDDEDEPGGAPDSGPEDEEPEGL